MKEVHGGPEAMLPEPLVVDTLSTLFRIHSVTFLTSSPLGPEPLSGQVS
jgi:hypothetical protein